MVSRHKIDDEDFWNQSIKDISSFFGGLEIPGADFYNYIALFNRPSSRNNCGKEKCSWVWQMRQTVRPAREVMDNTNLWDFKSRRDIWGHKKSRIFAKAFDFDQ